MQRLILVLTLAFFAIGISGCVSQQELEDAADRAEWVVEKSQTLEDKIRDALESNPPEKVEDGAIAEIIGDVIGRVNEDWVGTYENLRAFAGDARRAAFEFLEYLPELRANAQQRAINLREDAENYTSPWAAALNLGLEIGAFFFGAGGVVYGIRKTIAAVNANKDAETIIHSIEAAKDADPEIRAKLQSGQPAGNAAKTVTLARPSARARVMAIKSNKD